MPIEFPNTPASGTTNAQFVYDSAITAWRAQGSTNNVGTQIAALQAADAYDYHPNAVINGAFDIWQRGEGLSTASSASTGYVADRWQMFRDGYASGGATYRPSGPTGFKSAARVQRNAGNTSLAGVLLAQSIESLNSVPYAGKNVVLSFYARAGANYSSLGSSLTVSVVSGTGTDQNVSNGLTGQASVLGGNVALTTSWQRFTITGAVSASANQLAVSFYYNPTGTAGASDYFEVTGVQLEEGTSATPFRRAGGTIQGELAACQRYFIRYGGESLYSLFGAGYVESSLVVWVSFHVPVKMRTAPTLTMNNASSITVMPDGPAISTYAVDGNVSSAIVPVARIIPAAGCTAARSASLRTSANMSATVDWSAEL